MMPGGLTDVLAVGRAGSKGLSLMLYRANFLLVYLVDQQELVYYGKWKIPRPNGKPH